MAKSINSNVHKTDEIAVDIGINKEDRAKIAVELSKVLADTYTLYLMTHNFHWNVTGPMFNTLHNMFMDQYTEAWEALDEIAERIRALGHFAPGTYAEFIKLTSTKEPERVLSAEELIQALLDADDAVASTARHAFECAGAANDQPTADLLTARLEVHEKTAWMLRSMLA